MGAKFTVAELDRDRVQAADENDAQEGGDRVALPTTIHDHDRRCLINGELSAGLTLDNLESTAA